MNPSKPSLLVVSPPYELHFAGPFNVPRTTSLKIKNPTDSTILFKIKTTAPKRYCVRPNFGSINPNEFTLVDIVLQPFTYDPNEKNKHKFMVQSMLAPNALDDDFNPYKLWKQGEQSGQLMDCKLRCVFDMPPESAIASEKVVPLSTSVENTRSNQSFGNVSEAVSEPSEEVKEIIDEQVKYLREENVSLKQDNTKLKEQLARLMVSAKKDPLDHPYTPQFAEKQIPMFYIAMAIAAAIFGILLGKFLL